ncbi:MAG: DUF4140 domain-containing protein, partial [Bacteroidales bacterium]|nr:DUF4140 domain-containing protein [Bacteroidales bacterium]
MKKLSVLLLFISTSMLQAQEIVEKEIKSQISEVTVFLDGAQIIREKETDLVKGTSHLKFTGLSPFIDTK